MTLCTIFLLHDDTLEYIYTIPFKWYKHELLLPLKRIALFGESVMTPSMYSST